MRRVTNQYANFLLVGVSSVFVDIAVLNGLLLLSPHASGWTLTLDNTLSVIAAIANSYLFNTRITFRREATGHVRQRVLFILQALINIALNDLVLNQMTSIALQMGFKPLFATNIGKGFAMLVASSVTFFLLRTVVFAKKGTAKSKSDQRANETPFTLSSVAKTTPATQIPLQTGIVSPVLLNPTVRDEDQIVSDVRETLPVFAAGKH
ncbi:hypothetical protein B2M26_09175 [Ferroacidibacillus organovorans]|uniref:GtrA/DPMS transmembrane domain-containing protein n=1 Tax=Ferroacidibacillus organovorans TaxID=1765683 RepID=A0A1V4ES68_9BACL|nr:GtrA family protein [Ferroacidibacillus organovorans]OPG15779.1 hypothetical protein B2M26_09175 [Ferroacidibacillus organovorans]